MKHILTAALAAAVSLLSCTVVQAESTEFAGPSVAIGIEAARNRVEYGGYVGNQTSDKSATDARLDASYGWNLSLQWVLSLGGTYALGKSDFGGIRYLDGGTPVDVSLKLKDHYSIYLAPGFRVAPQWLVYGQLAWHEAKGEVSDSRYGSSTTRHHGLGWGVGVSHAIGERMELGAEVRQVNFNRQTTRLSNGKPEQTEVAFFLGYRFR